MADNTLSEQFNDPANKKFRKVWEKEADIADDFAMGVDWYKQWSAKRDAYAAQNDTARADSCQGLVDFWDKWLVKTAGHLAKHKMHVDAGKDSVMSEFNQKNLTLLQPVYDALSKLDDTQIKSGKAIFDALLPLMVEEPKAQPQAPKAGPLDNGNPFKKGPVV